MSTFVINQILKSKSFKKSSLNVSDQTTFLIGKRHILEIYQVNEETHVNVCNLTKSGGTLIARWIFSPEKNVFVSFCIP